LSRVEKEAIIEAWLQSFPNDGEALKVLSEWRIPCAPILDIGGALNHPQTRARGMVTEIEHPLLGKMPIVNTPFVLSETPRQIQGPALLLGQHNAEVLTEQLGYSAADVARLTQTGVLMEEEKVKELREKGAI